MTMLSKHRQTHYIIFARGGKVGAFQVPSPSSLKGRVKECFDIYAHITENLKSTFRMREALTLLAMPAVRRGSITDKI